jgi:hypothetical protein
MEWRATTGLDGNFSFEVLEPSTYCLELSYSGGRSALVMPIELGLREKKDLGDIPLTPGATIVGHVLVPPGRSLSGLVVYLDDWRRSSTQTTDAGGRFEFAGLADGTHTLYLEGIRGSMAPSDRFCMVLSPSETREVTLDLRDRGTATVALEVEVATGPREGLWVELQSSDDPEVMEMLGQTDDGGRVKESVRAIGTAYCTISTAEGIRIADHSRTLAVDLDASIDQRLLVDLGSLEVVLPPTLSLPDWAHLQLTLTPLEDSSLPKVQWGGGEPRVLMPGTTVSLDRPTRILSFRVLPAGRFDLVLEVMDDDEPSLDTVFVRQVAVEIPPRNTVRVVLE